MQFLRKKYFGIYAGLNKRKRNISTHGWSKQVKSNLIKLNFTPYSCVLLLYFQMSSCPNCRKPLPRCAICLMHMGTTTGDQCNSDGDGLKLVDFSHWFTWCQTCRHGGHASHMIHWFK